MDEYTYEYIPLRGISKSTLEFYDVKTKIDRHGKPVSLGFRYPNGAYKVRLLDRKDFYVEGEINKGGLFGRDRFSAGSNQSVIITEGEPDALSLYQVARVPVVSVQSASSGVRDCTNDRQWLNEFQYIYLAFDADAAGRELLRSVARLFDYNKIRVVKFDRYKDANDYLQHNEADELLNLWRNAKPYLPDTVISSFNDFKKILSEQPQWGVPYPFPRLTEMTYGIRKGEAVLITAQEGVGKTELMHAIEFNLLEKTDDAVGAIFLEEPKRRHLEAVAGIALRRPAHLPDSGCSRDQIISAIEQAVRKDDRLHLYSHFGSNDPELLLDEIRFLVSARSCGYVLLDHITMAVSGLSGEDERRALDYLSTRLEMMVKELDFSLIIVSHVNDVGQTRGSRYISKISDIRIDLSRDIVAGSNIVDILISKNRYSGKTGPAGSYMFDQFTRQYTPVDASNDNVPAVTIGEVA